MPGKSTSSHPPAGWARLRPAGLSGTIRRIPAITDRHGLFRRTQTTPRPPGRGPLWGDRLAADPGDRRRIGTPGPPRVAAKGRHLAACYRLPGDARHRLVLRA